nr:mediator of DNA damage checkpoint protein 1-like [Penaeus vannamei]
MANESNLQVSSERKDLASKEDYKASDMNDDDDNSSTVSENLLEQTTQPHYQDCLLKEDDQETKEENYYSDESTDMEDEVLAPKDTVKVQEVTNNSSILQTSNMSRLELSSDSDIIPEVSGTVTQSPKNVKSHQELEGQKDKALDGEKEQRCGDDGSQLSKAQDKVAIGKPGIHFTRVSKVVASDTVVPKSVGKAAKYNQSAQGSPCIDVKIYSSDSDDSDSIDSRTCKSESEKVKEVAEILSDSETDDDVGNVSQRLFEFSQEEVSKGMGEQTDNEEKVEEEDHNTKGRDKTEKQDKEIHKGQCQKTEKNTGENVTRDNEHDIQKENKMETPRKSKINTRKTLMKQIQSPNESQRKNDIRNMIIKKETDEKSDKCKEVGDEETKCSRTTRERRGDKRQTLELDSTTEQKTKSGRIRREPRRFSPDRNSEDADISSTSVISKGKTVNISKNMEEHVDVHPSKRARSSTPVSGEEKTDSSSARLGSSKIDPNKVDSQKKGLQKSVPQTKEIQPERVGNLQGKDSREIVGKQVKKDSGNRGRRSAPITLKEPKIEEQAQQSSLETEKIQEVQRKTSRASIAQTKNLVAAAEEQSLEPVRRGRRSTINNPKEDKTEKVSKLNRETRVTVADIVHMDENVHSQRRQCRSAFGRSKGNGNIGTNQITKKETEEKEIIVEPPRRGRRSAAAKSDEVMTEEADKAVKHKSLGTSVENKPKELLESENQKMQPKDVEDSMEEPPKQEVKVQPSRRGRRSAVPKSKESNEDISVSEKKSVETEIEPSRKGRRSAVPKSKEGNEDIFVSENKSVETEIEPSRKGRRSAVPKSKEGNEDIFVSENKSVETEIEPSRKGRRSAVPKSKEGSEDISVYEKKSVETEIEPSRKRRRSAVTKSKEGNEDISVSENKSVETEIEPSRKGRRPAVPKSKEGSEDISVSENKSVETEIEPSRKGRRSAIQKSLESGILKQARETEDNDTGTLSKEKTAGQQKRARRWVVSETKEVDGSTDSEKKSGLKLTIKSVQKESEETSRPQRKGRASIATSHPTVKEGPRSTRQVRLSMIPEKMEDENDGPSKSKRLKRSQDKDVGVCTSVEEKHSEMKFKDKRKQKQKNLAEESSDSESSSKRSSSQESQSSQGRKRARRNSNSSEDIHLTPKSARTRTKMDSPHSKGILWSPSQRQQQADVRPKVLFTGYKDQQDEKIVTDLGGMVVESPKECSVLVTMNIRRTCKLLAVIGKGMPIVTPQWLSASKLARNFVDPWKYIVKDTESEKKFAFRLDQSLQSARKSLLFEGLSFHATKSVKPPPDQMKEIIVCSGGIYMDVPPKRYSPEMRIISCPEDKNQWGAFKKLQIPVLGTEFILTGLLRHQLLLDDFVLA